MTDQKTSHALTESLLNVGLGVTDNKVQMHVELNAAYATLIGFSHKLNLRAFNANLLNDRRFLSQMVDISDYPPC